MVGGKVIGISVQGDEALVTCEDKYNVTSVRCKGGRVREIRLGDSVWWQCGKVYWTPKEIADEPTCNHAHHYSCRKPGIEYDIPFRKIGYSH